MKTLLATEVFPPQTGGSGRWFWEMYRRLPQHQTIIAAGQYEGSAEFDQTHSMRVFRLPLKMSAWGLRSRAGLAAYIRLFFQLRRLMRQQQVKQLHAGRLLPEGWLAWMLRQACGLPYLVYVHGEEVQYAATSRELSWMARQVIAGADVLIANSRNTAAILQDTWDISEQKVRILHPGVDTQCYRPAERDPLIRQQLGWGDRPVVLTVGRLQKRKGHDTMIRALRHIRQAVPDVLYVVAGDGEERAHLEQLVCAEQAGNHVQFLGALDEERLLKCYQQCDLFVLANRQISADIEGFGMVLLEAQACGKPVVAGASGGTVETMRPGHTGFCIPCDQHHELTAVLSKLLLDPQQRTTMGAAARQWVSSSFDWDSLVCEARTAFDDVCGGTKTRVMPGLTRTC